MWVVEGMCVFGAVDGRLACFNLNRSCPRVLLVLWNRIDGAACWESVFALSWGGVQVSVRTTVGGSARCRPGVRVRVRGRFRARGKC